MNIQWLGWLTKGHYEITLLDRVIGFVELVLFLVVALVLLVSYNVAKDKFRGKKN